jgi:hypothetical protein
MLSYIRIPVKNVNLYTQYGSIMPVIPVNLERNLRIGINYNFRTNGYAPRPGTTFAAKFNGFGYNAQYGRVMLFKNMTVNDEGKPDKDGKFHLEGPFEYPSRLLSIVGKSNNNSTSKFLILTEDQKEIKNLSQELIKLDRKVEKIKGDKHESILESLQKESQKQTGGQFIKNAKRKFDKDAIEILERDWERYLERKKKKNKTPKSKEEFTKKWWKVRKMETVGVSTLLGAKLGQLSGAVALAAGASGSVVTLLTAPIIGLGAVGLIISYLLIKHQHKRLTHKETKELLRKEIKERKDELKKLKQ